MHRAKGLEFKAVFVVDAADDVVPHPQAIDTPDDPADRAEALAAERQLLYVSLTRARDEAFVTWVGAPSRFLAPALAAQPSPPALTEGARGLFGPAVVTPSPFGRGMG